MALTSRPIRVIEVLKTAGSTRLKIPCMFGRWALIWSWGIILRWVSVTYRISSRIVLVSSMF